MKIADTSGIKGQNRSYIAERSREEGGNIRGIVPEESSPNTGLIDNLYHDARLKKEGRLHLHHDLHADSSDLADSCSLNRLLERINPSDGTGTQLRTSGRRILLALFGAAGFMITCAFAFHSQILAGLARAWVVKDAPIGEVDAIIVPGGGLSTRPFAAAKLYHADKTKRLVTFETEISASDELGITPPHHELNLQILEKLEVPLEAIVVIGDHVTSTWDEVEATRKWCLEHGVTSLAVVTEAYSSRRVFWAYQRGLRGSGIRLSVVTIGADDHIDDWWRHEACLIAFQNEVVKYLYYRVRY